MEISGEKLWPIAKATDQKVLVVTKQPAGIDFISNVWKLLSHTVWSNHDSFLPEGIEVTNLARIEKSLLFILFQTTDIDNIKSW